MLKNFFSKEGREIIKLTLQYENCKTLNKKIKTEVKKSTIEDIRSVFSDAVFLFSTARNEFFVTSVKGETFITGELKDNIPDISKSFSDESFNQQKSSMSNMGKNLIRKTENDLVNYDLSNRMIAQSTSSSGNRVKKSHYEYWGYDLNDLVRLTVKENNEIILRVNSLEKIPVNEVMQRLNNGIVHKWINNGVNGISRLDIEVDLAHCMSELMKFELSLFFDDRKPSPTNNNRDHLIYMYNYTVPIISSIASYMNKTNYDDKIVREWLEWLED